MSGIVIFSPSIFQGYGHEFDYATGLACALKLKGTIDVHVVGFDGPFRSRLPGELIPHTLQVESVANAKGSTALGQIKWGFRRISQSKKLVELTLDVARAVSASGVLFETFEYYTLARKIDRFECPLRCVFHDTSFNAKQSSIVAAIYKTAMAHSAAAIVARCQLTFVHGEAMKENLVKSLRLDSQTAARVIPIAYGSPAPFGSDQIDSIQARHALGIEDVDRPLLLAFGTLRRDKAFPLLLKGLSLVPDWSLLIAGPEGDMGFAELGALARQLGISGRVTFRQRFIPRAEQPLYFGAADAVIGIYSPSIRHESGTCQLARTYLKPIIAAGPPDLEKYVRNSGVGWSVPSFTAESLAETLAEVKVTTDENKNEMRKRIEWCAIQRSWPHVSNEVFGGWI